VAYLTITRITGDPARLLADYRATSDTMDLVGHAHSLIVHAGGATANGLLMVNLWPSRGASEAAAADPRRLAVLEQVALTPDQVAKEHHELERLVAPALVARPER
jgi:hypothetical protein